PSADFSRIMPRHTTDGAVPGSPGRDRLGGGFTVKRAFIAALAVGAIALIAGATAASSARPSSLKHYMIGFGHSPSAADKALVKNHGGIVRYSFGSIGVLAVDLAPGQVNAIK